MAQLDRGPLLDEVDANIPTNGNEEIDAVELRQVLYDFVDSFANLNEDRKFFGLQNYSILRDYIAGETCVYNGKIYQALVNNQGSFDPAQWSMLSEKVFDGLTIIGTGTAIDPYKVDKTLFVERSGSGSNPITGDLKFDSGVSLTHNGTTAKITFGTANGDRLDVVALDLRLDYTTIRLNGVDYTNRLSYLDATSSIQTQLNAKEAIANKGAADGYAPLNSSAKIDSVYLPSFVDDVEEYADLAAFPATGEASKIYVAIDTNKVYRWSGSAYVEISPSPGSTDAVPEGALNLYFTNARVDTRLNGYSGPVTFLNGVSDLTDDSITYAKLIAMTSANLLSKISDPTGNGSAVFSNSPALAGTPTAPTQPVGTNNTTIATTEYVDAKKEYVPQSIGWTSIFSPADASTYYFSGYHMIPNLTNLVGRRKTALVTGNIVAISLSLNNGAVSTNENNVLKIRNEATATEVVITSTWQITGQGQWYFEGFSLPITEGEAWVLVWDTPAWGTNPANLTLSGEILIEKTA